MSLTFNGLEPSVIKYNDTELTEVFVKSTPQANPVSVWSSKPVTWVIPCNQILRWSNDGITWEPCLTDRGYLYTGDYIDSVSYANGIWVATCNKGLIYSTIGKVWHPSNITSSESSGSFSRPVYANGVWLTTNEYGLYSSIDGKQWSKVAVPDDEIYDAKIRYANGIWVAGTVNGLYWSTDGFSWNKSNITNDSCAGGARYANGIWVACPTGNANDSPSLYWSANGKTWTSITLYAGGSSVSLHFNAARYANGIWVACNFNAYHNYSYWSSDGKNWQGINNAPNMSKGARYANGIWVCIGNVDTSSSLSYYTVYWSTDGRTWYPSNLSREYMTFAGAVYADGVWVLSVNYSSRGVWIYTSSDGKTWTRAESSIDSNFYHRYQLAYSSKFTQNDMMHMMD